MVPPWAKVTFQQIMGPGLGQELPLSGLKAAAYKKVLRSKCSKTADFVPGAAGFAAAAGGGTPPPAAVGGGGCCAGGGGDEFMVPLCNQSSEKVQ
jgi:hypothetical protein